MKREAALLFYALFLIRKISNTSIKECAEKMKNAIVPPKISTTEHFAGTYNYDGLKALNDFNAGPIVQDSSMTEYQRIMKKDNKLLANDELNIREYETFMDKLFRNISNNEGKPRTRPLFISEVEVDLCETAVPQFLGLYNEDYIANVPYEVFARQVKLSSKVIRDINPPEIFTWKCSYLLYKSTINEPEDQSISDISSPIVGRLDLGFQIFRTEVAEYLVGKFEKNGKFRGLNVVKMYAKNNSFRVTILPTPTLASDPHYKSNITSNRTDGFRSKELAVTNIIPLSVVPLRAIAPDNVMKIDSPRNSKSEKQNSNKENQKRKLDKTNKKTNSKTGELSEKCKNILYVSSGSSSDSDEVNEARENIRKNYSTYGKSKTQKESKVREEIARSGSKYRKNKDEKKRTSETKSDLVNQKTSAISNENDKFNTVDSSSNDTLKSVDLRELPETRNKLHLSGQNVQICPPTPTKSDEIKGRKNKPISEEIVSKFSALRTVIEKIEKSKESSRNDKKILPLSDLYRDTSLTKNSNTKINKNDSTDRNINKSIGEDDLGKQNKNIPYPDLKTASLTRIYDKTSPRKEDSKSGRNEFKIRETSRKKISSIAYGAGNITNSAESDRTISKSYGTFSTNNNKDSSDIRSDRSSKILGKSKTQITELADSSISNRKTESAATFLAIAPVVRQTYAPKVPKLDQKSIAELYDHRAKSNDSNTTTSNNFSQKNDSSRKTLPLEIISYPSAGKKKLSLKNDESKIIENESIAQSDSGKSGTKRRKKKE